VRLKVIGSLLIRMNLGSGVLAEGQFLLHFTRLIAVE